MYKLIDFWLFIWTILVGHVFCLRKKQHIFTKYFHKILYLYQIIKCFAPFMLGFKRIWIHGVQVMFLTVSQLTWKHVLWLPFLQVLRKLCAERMRTNTLQPSYYERGAVQTLLCSSVSSEFRRYRSFHINKRTMIDHSVTSRWARSDRRLKKGEISAILSGE